MPLTWFREVVLKFFFSFLFSRHVFKRLKFLGNKTLSHVATLVFLAIWHGLHSGYILCFSMEFFIITVERQVRVLEKNPTDDTNEYTSYT